MAMVGGGRKLLRRLVKLVFTLGAYLLVTANDVLLTANCLDTQR